MGPETAAVCQQDSVLDTALPETNTTGQGFKDPDMNFLRREISDAFHWLLIINALLPAQLCWLLPGHPVLLPQGCAQALAAVGDKDAVPAVLAGTAECSWGAGDGHGHCRMGSLLGSAPTAGV